MTQFVGRLAIIAAMGLIVSSPASARKPTTLESNAAYVLIEVEDVKGAIKGTRIPGLLTIARYDPAREDVRGGDRSPATALPRGESPRVTFAKDAIAKRKGRKQYLVKVSPDTWVVEGLNGTAFSLGSYTFNVAPGEIVDLGVFVPSIDRIDGDKTPGIVGTVLSASLFGLFGGRPEPRPLKVEHHIRGGADMTLPVILAGRRVVQANLAPGARFGNYLGGLVNRFGGHEARESDKQQIQVTGSETLHGQ